ncbi:conserved hypothetical protein [Burkholderia sp. 8Y]|uniref:hypothetical protein n=1 Tax=Burkholderia sp. 8Y TaxID=2653133 RepID=UPI0012F15AF9|nr:hypothetical protein [Burkholderia sp. 8Y]VXB67323.1 conserved hypothetical protein [Burkholderia sp. 8Y]
MAALLDQFTTIDPVERLNLPLKLSTRISLEQYVLFYIDEYKTPVQRNALIEEMLVKFRSLDPGFDKFVKKMTLEQKALVEQALRSQKGSRQTDAASDAPAHGD